ncbi:MAG: hypothetical protein IPL92_11235 [Saprospiraceae bacterium]|nr:hypothetical protein [Candidatus Opimibacter iunctus]
MTLRSLALKQYAEDLGVETLDQFVRHLSNGAGVCTNDLPWIALSAKKKIGHIKNLLQTASSHFRDGKQELYEREATYLYGLLRETWERALEEVLLNGIVERYRPSIQTQRIKLIADITKDDCDIIENAMTKCSAWLPGHDTAPAARSPIPEPDELKADIDSLEKWMEEIRKRRA